MMSDTTSLQSLEWTGHDEQERGQEPVDFKMVTFSLGGKDYGIDIMRIKEIAKFHGFTYVPNTAPYVRGVYNLRGDIISIIDLRLMFNLPAEQLGDEDPENGLILRLENTLMGVVVDRIDKVVGISSTHVQPPHPIFGDINVKFISGVAEYEGRLYIILDVDRIFSRDSEEESAREKADPPLQQAVQPAASEAAGETTSGDNHDVQRHFVLQGLSTYAGWTGSSVNVDWFNKRFDDWVTQRNMAGKEAQFADAQDAQQFLEGFPSRHTDRIWDASYAADLRALLPMPDGPIVQVWNPGCGGGYESYSAALMLMDSGAQLKILASDKDLMQISTAPNLVVSETDVPEEWRKHLVQGKKGLGFSQQVRDSVTFEFSDVLNTAGLPRIDIVLARDLLSLHSEADQGKILMLFEECLRPGGILIVGDNERAPSDAGWEEITGETVSVYRRR